MVLETKRLHLREMRRDDFGALCKILQDEEVMYAYEHAFSHAEAQAWLDKQLGNYASHGFGLWAVTLKDSDEMIGQCGLTMQDFNGREVVEAGYLFQRVVWGNGYASEAAIACKEYAFKELKVEEVFSIIRTTNHRSQKVAIANGMVACGQLVKHYYGIDMPHLVFSVQNTL